MTVRGRLSVSRRLLLHTNLFDVIASLGAGLYVHHIELASFPLCRLNRHLPVNGPGEGRREMGRRGGEGRRDGVEGRHKRQTGKIKQNQNDTEGTEQKRRPTKYKAKPKGGHTDKRSTHNNKQCQNKSLDAAFTKQTDA